MIIVDNYSLVDPETWRWPHFTPREMACHGDGSLKISEDFMDRLESLRLLCGFKLPIGSGYRNPAYNNIVSETGDDGPHTTGQAADILVMGSQALILVGHAIRIGFTGIGLRQSGDPAKRFVHVDACPPLPTGPRPWIWTYNAG